MKDLALSLRSASALAALVTAVVATSCSSAAPSSSGHAAGPPEVDQAPRVFIDALLLDVPSDGLAETGKNLATMSFGALVAQAGAHHVVSSHAIATDDVVARLSDVGSAAAAPASPPAAAPSTLAGYRLDVKPHVVEGGRVRLDVDFELAGKKAKTTVVVDDKQLVVLGTEAMAKDRRFVLLVRPNIVRSDADLTAMLEQKARAIAAEKAAAATK
jgi:hypothetical protein